MARKITMFELHFDGGSFGRSPETSGDESPEPTVLSDETAELPEEAVDGRDTDAPDTTGSDGPTSSSGSLVRRAITVLGVMWLATLAGRRLRRDGEEVDGEREIDVEAAGKSGPDGDSAEIAGDR